MTQEFRSAVYSLCLPVSESHRHSSLGLSGHLWEPGFHGVRIWRSREWRASEDDAWIVELWPAAQFGQPCHQKQDEELACFLLHWVSFPSGERKRQWRRNRTEEKWNINKLNSLLSRKVQLKKKKRGEKCRILIWTIAPCLMLLAKQRREMQKKSESEGRCHGEFQWDEFLINSKEHDATWI